MQKFIYQRNLKKNHTQKNQRFIDTLFMNDRSPNSAGLEKIKISNQTGFKKLQTNKQKIDCLIILEMVSYKTGF